MWRRGVKVDVASYYLLAYLQHVTLSFNYLEIRNVSNNKYTSHIKSDSLCYYDCDTVSDKSLKMRKNI